MTQKRKGPSKTKARRRQTKNPAPLKKLNKSTGWMKADAVQIRRNKGKIEVYIRRKRKTNPAKKRVTKRTPAKRKPAKRRKR